MNISLFFLSVIVVEIPRYAVNETEMLKETFRKYRVLYNLKILKYGFG